MITISRCYFTLILSTFVLIETHAFHNLNLFVPSRLSTCSYHYPKSTLPFADRRTSSSSSQGSLSVVNDGSRTAAMTGLGQGEKTSNSKFINNNTDIIFISTSQRSSAISKTTKKNRTPKQFQNKKKHHSTKDKLWNLRYTQLLDYQSQNGHANVPRQYKPNPQLGGWVNTQRHQYKRLLEGNSSTLTKERMDKLDELGFSWFQRGFQMWNQRYEELKEFKNLHGHCRVSQCDETYRALGLWVMTQRKQYKEYMQKHSSGVDGNGMEAGATKATTTTNQDALTKERIHILNQLGFVWEVFGQTRWDKQCEQLERFRGIYGHVRVPRIYEPDPSLAQWVQDQRRQYKIKKSGNKSALTESRIQKLESLGFVWSIIK